MTVLTEATMPQWHALCFLLGSVALMSFDEIGPNPLPKIVATELIHLKPSGAVRHTFQQSLVVTLFDQWISKHKGRTSS
jgi:hypothetical protein